MCVRPALTFSAYLQIFPRWFSFPIPLSSVLSTLKKMFRKGIFLSFIRICNAPIFYIQYYYCINPRADIMKIKLWGNINSLERNKRKTCTMCSLKRRPCTRGNHHSLRLYDRQCHRYCIVNISTFWPKEMRNTLIIISACIYCIRFSKIEKKRKRNPFLVLPYLKAPLGEDSVMLFRPWQLVKVTAILKLELCGLVVIWM